MKHRIKLLIICIALLGPLACQKGEIPNLNTPVAGDLVRRATKEQLATLVVGLESGTRLSIATYYDGVSILGREAYRFSGSEPRWTTEMMGTGELDNNTFYTTNPWTSRYRIVRQGYILIDAATNSAVLSAEEKKGYIGFAKTVMAHQLLMNLTMTWSNGIRTDVKDPEKLGPFKPDQAALTDIATLLDEAKADLTGSAISFPLSSGYTGFKTPAGMLQFNRALAARVAVYRQQWAAALTALNESFFNLNGAFATGVSHEFSGSSGDLLNPLYLPQNSPGEKRLAHPSYVADITPGDDRIGKATLRNDAPTLDNLTSNRDIWIIKTNTDFFPIIRNEELVLIYAEAKIQLTAFPDAIVALNRIRTGHNLPVYAGAATSAALITEMLRQRRFSLFAEGHRWVDMRRYNRLAELPNTRVGDKVWDKYPIPLTEAN
ncbi:RagB/SusD family nutrient uptake outer membrane protein [Chitinophaga sp. SYP-B3965]|uniref:RagB/SusD family nutrient uptake outer membrane protein n=1 Tax=Chitinophaga sp. SYP-B3965 TaxID=2663120 RepID=UPI001299FB45|nr:RagB/SusD family nutrient uptake outer membrane protein [Chitinophaga sp. SYP-B3965]MRG48547.1 RagB/SusD family nutrient uptake outer membrane protein [Chitinophaga sp. SYP-B3965]